MENLQINPNYDEVNEHTFCYRVEVIAEDGSTIEVINYEIVTDQDYPSYEDLEGYFEERYPEADEIICQLTDIH